MVDGFFDKFHIGTYCLCPNARDEEHVRELAECGIDLLFGINNDRALLDLLHRYGIHAVVNGVVPGWFGADGKNAGTMHATNPEDAYLSRAALFKDHPAIVGIDIGDEPSLLDFPYYGKIVRLLSGIFPSKLLYLNIYPSYGMLAGAGHEQAERELGTASYEQYLCAYLEHVPLPYLSIDHYAYSSSIDRLISDLETASVVCKRHGKPLMTVLQVNSNDSERYLTADELRLEAWLALAYGARTVSWACYSPGWWHNNVLDKYGTKTEQYEKLKTVNRELRAFTEEYQGYTHALTHRLAKGDELSTALGTLYADCTAVIGELEGEAGNALIIAPTDMSGDIAIKIAPKDEKTLLMRTLSGVETLAKGVSVIRKKAQPIFIFEN